MRVYKFLDARWAIEALRKRRIKKSLIPELNDPWEGRPVDLKTDENSKAFDVILRAASLRMGVCSFSRTWSNPLTWSHYADNHRGIVLGFDVSGPLPEDYLRPVEYLDRPLTLEELKIENGQIEAKDWLRILTVKYKPWEYEQEIRVFSPLESPDPLNGLFFLHFSSHFAVREIIFGSRHASFNELTECLALAREIGGIHCRKAIPSRDRFEIVEDPTYMLTIRSIDGKP